MRQLSIRGLENFPKDKPIILISNHQNAMLDPVLLCVFMPRQLHWLTRADVFKKGLVEKFLHRLNMMPVYRERDGVDDLRLKNQLVFEECFRRLSSGAAIAMFPEGTHRGKKQLIPFKKGLSRLAFGAYSAGVEDLQIVPIGLDYSGFYDYHPEFSIRIGHAIDVKQYANDTDVASAMNRLLSDAKTALSNLMVDAQYEEHYETIVGMRGLVMSLSPSKSFGGAFDFYMAFTKKWENKNDQKLNQTAKEYLEISSRFAIDDLESDVTVSKQNLRLIALGIFLPIYLWGRSFYAPLERWIEGFIKKVVKDLLFKNSLRLAFFTFLAPLYTLVIAVGLALVLDWSFITTLCIIALQLIVGRLAIFWLRMYHRWRKGNRMIKWRNSSSTERLHWGEKRETLVSFIKSEMKEFSKNV